MKQKPKRTHRIFEQSQELERKICASLLANKTVKQAAQEAKITRCYCYQIVRRKLKFVPVFLSPAEQAMIQFARKGGRK